MERYVWVHLGCVDYGPAVGYVRLMAEALIPASRRCVAIESALQRAQCELDALTAMDARFPAKWREVEHLRHEWFVAREAFNQANDRVNAVLRAKDHAVEEMLHAGSAMNEAYQAGDSAGYEATREARRQATEFAVIADNILALALGT